MKSSEQGFINLLIASALPAVALNLESSGLFLFSILVTYVYLLLYFNLILKMLQFSYGLSKLVGTTYKDLSESDKSKIKEMSDIRVKHWVSVLGIANGILFAKNEFMITGILTIAIISIFWYLVVASNFNAKHYMSKS